MTLLYIGAGGLVMAQILGIFALVTHKADLVFSLVMLVIFVAAVTCGGYGAYHQLR